MNMSPSIRATNERGFTLIEVLVAMLILAIGLLGLAGLQSRAQQAEMESYQRAQALLMLDDMVQRLRSDSANIRFNRENLGLSCYDGTVVGTGGALPGGCGTLHLQQWHDLLNGGSEVLGGQNVGGIIGARGCINLVSTDPSPGGMPVVYRISVAWQGLMPTAPPPAAPAGTDCGAGAYGDERLRRAVYTSVTISDIN